MKKEEPSMGSPRGNPSSPEETLGSLSRPGRTVAAPIAKPALRLNSEFPRDAVADASSNGPVLPMLIWIRT